MASGRNVPATIPAMGGEAGLNRYLAEIKKFPILAPEERLPVDPNTRGHVVSRGRADIAYLHDTFG